VSEQREPDLIDLQPGPRRSARPAVRVTAVDRNPLAIGVLMGAFLVLAVAKPWDASGPSAATAPPTSVAPAVVRVVAAVTPEPATVARLREHCQEPLGWRVYTREGRNGRSLRAWYSVEPTTRADGPLDRSIPQVQLGPGIDALGYCSPWSGPERPPGGAVVRAWRLEAASGQAAVLELDVVAPSQPTILGSLYQVVGDAPGARSAAPRASASSDGPDVTGWAAGRYVFAIRALTWERWWAIDVAEPDLPTAAPSVAAPTSVP
jgi:hypothetical protein